MNDGFPCFNQFLCGGSSLPYGSTETTIDFWLDFWLFGSTHRWGKQTRMLNIFALPHNTQWLRGLWNHAGFGYPMTWLTQKQMSVKGRELMFPVGLDTTNAAMTSLFFGLAYVAKKKNLKQPISLGCFGCPGQVTFISWKSFCHCFVADWTPVSSGRIFQEEVWRKSPLRHHGHWWLCSLCAYLHRGSRAALP